MQGINAGSLSSLAGRFISYSLETVPNGKLLGRLQIELNPFDVHTVVYHDVRANKRLECASDCGPFQTSNSQDNILVSHNGVQLLEVRRLGVHHIMQFPAFLSSNSLRVSLEPVLQNMVAPSLLLNDAKEHLVIAKMCALHTRLGAAQSLGQAGDLVDAYSGMPQASYNLTLKLRGSAELLVVRHAASGALLAACERGKRAYAIAGVSEDTGKLVNVGLAGIHASTLDLGHPDESDASQIVHFKREAKDSRKDKVRDIVFELTRCTMWNLYKSFECGLSDCAFCSRTPGISELNLEFGAHSKFMCNPGGTSLYYTNEAQDASNPRVYQNGPIRVEFKSRSHMLGEITFLPNIIWGIVAGLAGLFMLASLIYVSYVKRRCKVH